MPINPDRAAVDEPLHTLLDRDFEQMPRTVEIDPLEELVGLRAFAHRDR